MNHGKGSFGHQWPSSLLRFIGSDDGGAFSQAVASLKEEAAAESGAVSALLWEFMAPPIAPEASYDQARAATTPERRAVIDLLQFYERIVSSLADYALADVEAGLSIARGLGHPGCVARFLMLESQAHYQAGAIPDAATTGAESLDRLLKLAAEDDAYLQNARKVAPNAIQFLAFDGDFERARALFEQARHLVPGDLKENIGRLVGPDPDFGADPDAIAEHGSELLHSGQALRAVEWLGEARRRHSESGDDGRCCGLLGDLAVAFRSIRNEPRAVATYREAIDLCRREEDFVNLSRWTQNLSLILAKTGARDEARSLLEEASEAAQWSGDRYQVSTAVGNLGFLYAQDQRYSESVACMDRALEHADDPKLARTWRANRLALLHQWADKLHEENQTARAAEIQARAIEASPVDTNREKSRAAVSWSKLAALQEYLHRLPESIASLERSLALFKEIGDEAAVTKIQEMLEQVDGPRTRIIAAEHADAVGELRRLVAEAVEREDVEAELDALTRLASTLLLQESDDAVPTFEEALARVRIADIQRHELSLTTNFAPHFIKRGEVDRALRLAERAYGIAASGTVISRFIAGLNLAQVWDEGFNEGRRALDYYKEAVQQLKNLRDESPEQAGLVVEARKRLLARGCQLALEFEGVDQAVEMLATWDDPAVAARLRELEAEISTPETSAVSRDELAELQEPALDVVLTAWRATAEGRLQGAKPPPDSPLRAMAEFAGIIDWPEMRDRLVRVCVPAATAPLSRGGPAGFLELARRVAAKRLAYGQALEFSQTLNIARDDIPCLVLYAFAVLEMRTNGGMRVLWRIVTDTAADNRVVARVLNLLGIFDRDPQQKAAFYARGAKRLADGSDDRYRAHLLIETAAVLLQLGRSDQAMARAEDAIPLADAADDPKMAANARGNAALAKMNMGRFDEALATFKSLAGIQEAIGDERGLDATRTNIATCRVKLGDFESAAFDTSTGDFVDLFNEAQRLAVLKRSDAAIPLFEQALEAVRKLDCSSVSEAVARSLFARTLWDAGRFDEATLHMRQAAALAEKNNEPGVLQDAYSWLALVAVAEPSRGPHYAEQALAAARRQGDPEELALALAEVGQSRMLAGRPAEAVTLLQESLKHHNCSVYKMTLADALVSVGQQEEARAIYAPLLELARTDGDPDLGVDVHVGLADICSSLGHFDESINHLQQARDLLANVPSDRVQAQVAKANVPSDRVQAQVANRLGVAFRQAGHVHDATQEFERGLKVARRAGLEAIELTLLSNLGQVLHERGDLDGAKAMLTHVRQQSRANGHAVTEATALAALANVSATAGQNDDAMDGYQEAARLAKQARVARVEGASLDSIGGIHSGRGHPARAVEYHERAVEIHRRLNVPQSLIVSLLNLAQAQIALKEFGLAETTLDEIEQVRHSTGTAVPEAQLLTIRALIRHGRGDWPAARELFRQAITALERIRSQFRTPAQKRDWAEHKTDVYRVATGTALEVRDVAAAVEFIESNRTRFLDEELHRRAQRPKGVSAEDWIRYHRAIDRRAQIRAERLASLTAANERLDDGLRRIEAEYEEARAAVAGTLVRADGETGFVIPNIGSLAARLPVGHVAAYVAAVPDGIQVITVRNQEDGVDVGGGIAEGFGLRELHTLVFGHYSDSQVAVRKGSGATFPAAELGWMAATTLIGVDGITADVMTRVYDPAYATARSLAPQTMEFVLETLGRNIWPAILDALPAETTDLVLLLSGPLGLLPLHAARLHDGSYAQEKFHISYLPSLRFLREDVADLEDQPLKHIGLAVDPTQNLPFAKLEAWLVSDRGSWETTDTRKGAEATANEVLALLESCPMFYFAGHGFYDNDEPLQSGLVCASADSDKSVLTLRTVLESMDRVNSRFIVLSACETGRVEAGDVLDDFLGLPGGFLLAGASGVLSSLWRVDDRATCVLVAKFAEVWDGRLSTAPKALADTQQWLRTVTAETLAGMFAAARERLEDAGDEELYERASDAWRAFATAQDPESMPFSRPVFWAAFAVTGA